MVSWPEGGQLPVNAGVGHDEGHGTGEEDPSQDASPYSRGSHHASNRGKLSLHRSEKSLVIIFEINTLANISIVIVQKCKK